MPTEQDLNEAYWANRYRQNQTQWDVGAATEPLKAYIDQLTRKDQRILLAGGGNGYEAEYLHQQGFTQVFLLDFAAEPLANFQRRVPDFPLEHLLRQDFFSLTPHRFDLVLEQTFFCALPRSRRAQYARQVFDLLVPGGKLAGVLFSEEFEKEGPPRNTRPILSRISGSGTLPPATTPSSQGRGGSCLWCWSGGSACSFWREILEFA